MEVDLPPAKNPASDFIKLPHRDGDCRRRLVEPTFIVTNLITMSAIYELKNGSC